MARTFDARPCPEAGLDDLEIDLFLHVSRRGRGSLKSCAPTNKSGSKWLRWVLRPREGLPDPRGSAAVWKAPCRFLPGAYVQYLRIDGAPALCNYAVEAPRAGRDLMGLMQPRCPAGRNPRGQTDPCSTLRDGRRGLPPCAARESCSSTRSATAATVLQCPCALPPLRGQGIQIKNPGGL